MAAAMPASDDDDEALRQVDPLVQRHYPQVYLNVYDLADIGMCVDVSSAVASLNKRTLETWDVGVFHAGVEIAGVEYSFGYCEEGTGVYACEPREAYGAKFRTALVMGRSRCAFRAVDRHLTRLAATWSGASYSLLSRNCCHFADAFCTALGVGRIPPWVNGLARSLEPYATFPGTTTFGGLSSSRGDPRDAFRKPPTASLTTYARTPPPPSSKEPVLSTKRDGGGGPPQGAGDDDDDTLAPKDAVPAANEKNDDDQRSSTWQLLSAPDTSFFAAFRATPETPDATKRGPADKEVRVLVTSVSKRKNKPPDADDDDDDGYAAAEGGDDSPPRATLLARTFGVAPCCGDVYDDVADDAPESSDGDPEYHRDLRDFFANLAEDLDASRRGGADNDPSEEDRADEQASSSHDEPQQDDALETRTETTESPDPPTKEPPRRHSKLAALSSLLTRSSSSSSKTPASAA